MPRINKAIIKARKTRRLNQVKSRLSTLNIGGRDYENLKRLLTKDTGTVKGYKRSQRIEELMFVEKDYEKLLKFKEFKDVKLLDKENITLGTLGRSLRKDADFYFENYNDIIEYNDEYKNLLSESGRNLAATLIKKTESGRDLKQRYDFNEYKKASGGGF